MASGFCPSDLILGAGSEKRKQSGIATPSGVPRWPKAERDHDYAGFARSMILTELLGWQVAAVSQGANEIGKGDLQIWEHLRD
jgi:hypothetical protein